METSMEPKSKIVLVVSVNSVLWGEVATTWWSPNVPLRTYLTSVPLLSTSSPYPRHHHQIIEAPSSSSKTYFLSTFSVIWCLCQIYPRSFAFHLFPTRFVLASFTNSLSEGSFTLVCRDIDLFLQVNFDVNFLWKWQHYRIGKERRLHL